MINRRRLLLGSATALATGSVQAQQTCFDRFDRCFGNAPSGGYSGPGNIVSGATAWYGLRAYSRAKTSGTQKAVNIRRASDNATTDILILPNGNLDVATATTFLAATTGFVVTWYDQTGNGRDATQATPAAQPQLVLSGLNTRPAVAFVGASSQGLLGTIPNVSIPYSYYAVAVRTNTAAASIIAANTSFNPYVGFDVAATAIGYCGTNVTATAADNTAHSFGFVISGANASALIIDGTSTPSGALQNRPTSTTISLGQSAPSSAFLTGSIAEAGLWPSALSAGSQAAMQANQKAYWGTP